MRTPCDVCQTAAAEYRVEQSDCHPESFRCEPCSLSTSANAWPLAEPFAPAFGINGPIGTAAAPRFEIGHVREFVRNEYAPHTHFRTLGISDVTDSESGAIQVITAEYDPAGALTLIGVYDCNDPSRVFRVWQD